MVGATTSFLAWRGHLTRHSPRVVRPRCGKCPSVPSSSSRTSPSAILRTSSTPCDGAGSPSRQTSTSGVTGRTHTRRTQSTKKGHATHRCSGLRTVLPKPLPSTAARRIAAGRAVGRSFRDKMGDSAETWQFDEISRLVTRSRPTREFARGVLDGLHDDSLRGFVWLAHSAFGLASQPVDAELSAFWQTLSAAASHVVGEEFPPFAGDPVAAAHAMDAGRRALAAGGPVRRSLARRYQAGITPGYRLAPGLGGNVNHRSRAYVNSWRTRYLSARRDAGLRRFRGVQLPLRERIAPGDERRSCEPSRGFPRVIPPTGDEKSPAIAHIESTGRKARRPEFGHAVWPQRKSPALRLLPRSR